MLSYHEIKEREAVVKDMIDRGMSLSEMARELDITQQSVHKFLRVRGWKTAGTVARLAAQDPEALAKEQALEAKRKARAEKRKLMTETVDRSGAGRHKAKTKPKD